MSGRRAMLLSSLVVITVTGIAMSLILGDEAAIVLPVAYGLAGAYVVARRPTNPIGWLLITTGWGVVIGTLRVDAPAEVLLAGDLDPIVAFTAWANMWGFSLAFVGLTWLAVVFPDGHQPRGPWRVVNTVALVVAVAITVVIAIGPTIVPTPDGATTGVVIPNPYALAPDAAIWAQIPSASDLYPVLLVALAATLSGLVVRSRRAVGAARLQYRWFVTSLALVLVLTALWAITVFLFAADAQGPTWLLAILGFAAVPVAIAVAVMRYRLFEIDRIISRTIGYSVVTSVLFVVFSVVNLAAQATIGSALGSNAAAIAVSTLAVAALFQPVRRRIQGVVDRRFHRARYDAEQTVEGFARRLRDDLDLPSLTHELQRATTDAVAPTVATVWLRRPSTAVGA